MWPLSACITSAAGMWCCSVLPGVSVASSLILNAQQSCDLWSMSNLQVYACLTATAYYQTPSGPLHITAGIGNLHIQ